MKKREPVSHIMTKNVMTIADNGTLRDVVKIFKENPIHHLPVTKGDSAIGIVSSSDLNRLTMGGLFGQQQGYDEGVLDMLKLDQLMTANPLTVSSDQTVKEVAEIFAKENFHAIPVTENGKVAGIVTSKDVLNYFLDQL